MPRQTILNANASPYFQSGANLPIRITSPTGITTSVPTISIGLFCKLLGGKYAQTFPHLFNIGAEDEISVFTSNTNGNLTFKSLAITGQISGSTLLPNTLLPGVWHSIVITYDGTTVKGYVDGANTYTETKAGSFTLTNTTITAFSNSSVASPTGNISDFFVSTNVMSSQDVLDFHVKQSIPSNCVVSWPLSEGAGTIAYDTSGNGNNGTITSPTWTRDAPSKTRKAVNGNLVYNGDFEIAPVVNVPQTNGYKWYDGTVGGTSISGSPSITTNRVPGIYYWDEVGQGSIMLDSTEKHSGNYSLEVSTLATGSYAIASLGDFLLDDYIKLLPSTSYTYSYWMKTNYVSGDATNGASVIFIQKDGARNTGTATVGGYVKTTTDWTQYTGTFTTGATTRAAIIQFVVDGDNGAATLIMDAWFDDITLTPTTATTRNVPTKLPLSEPSENLLYNSNFESSPAFTAATTTTVRWIDGTAGGSLTNTYGWLTSFANSCSAQFDTTEKFSGSSSMKVSTTGANAAAQVISTVLPTSSSTSYIDILPNTQYRVTFKMKTNLISGDSRGAFLRFSQFDSAKTASLGVDSTYIKTTTDWTTYTITFVTSPVAYYGQIKLFVYAQDAPATLLMDAWFDDIQFIKLIPPRKTPDNLLSNGNFEYAPPFTAVTTTTARWIDGTSGGSSATTGPYGWYIGAKGGSVAASFDSTAPTTGTNSLKLSTTGTASRIEVYSFSSGNPGKKLTLIPALPNTTYTMTFSMKTNVVSGSATGVNAGIFEYDGQGTSITSLRSTAVNTTTDKTFYTVTKTTSSTTRFVGAVIILEGSDGAGTLIMDAWFDDITLTTTSPYVKRKSIDNLLINGDFESAPTFVAATTTTSTWIDGTAAGSTATTGPYGWGLFGASLSTSAQFDTAQTKTGQYSLKLSTLSANRICTVAPQIAVTTQGIPSALPGTTYSYSFWMKTNKTSGDSAGAYVDFLERNGAGNAGASHLSTQVNTTTDWTYYSGSFTTASTCRFITPKLFVEGNTGTATLIMDAWFDDITLVKN